MLLSLVTGIQACMHPFNHSFIYSTDKVPDIYRMAGHKSCAN
jgi:hypothetical protein